jgi:hypothetical protein
MACIVLITLALLASNSQTIYKKLIDFSCIGLFVGAAAALYKLMIQYGIMAEASFLKADIPQNVSVSEMEAIIQKNQMESCANINSTIFGTPDSAYAFVIFVFLLIYLFSCFRSSDVDINKRDE